MREYLTYMMGIILALYIGHVAMVPGETLDLEHTKTVRVVAGDTLWSIASRETPESMDVREMIHTIKEINHIGDASALKPGAAVEVPTVRKHEETRSTALAMYLQNER